MIKGIATYRVDLDAWEFGLIDRENARCFTIEIKEHMLKPGMRAETSVFQHGQEDIATALSQVLTQMGILSGNATDTELKATKYHLEDMRKLALK